MKVEGACHCGYITYKATVDPGTVAICHCTDCQVLSGSAFRTFVPAAKELFELRTGEPKVYLKRAARALPWVIDLESVTQVVEQEGLAEFLLRRTDE